VDFADADSLGDSEHLVGDEAEVSLPKKDHFLVALVGLGVADV
jgi:hypothetical protein